ncbi:hypothetical protein B0F90DRAFT_1755372 [Multifurca ochricompacta]|uniref:Shugoshin C-terminal domain-containing protein n=1 Tax=Multifurca ochricompacta TaxID=376703 RepID=A0AAD4QKL2_9AGAM|nr:hypothetical protein B0F90DRAFT_1755372 [Multifurca ochricompacta]
MAPSYSPSYPPVKKKFLLANKHITKLNSTLSIRIEELNAQISSLHVENLRLRASEIALGSQIKKEREKSQRIIADAESAIHNLMKSFGSIRKNFNISSPKPPSPKREPVPKARRLILNPDASPHANRLARPPRFPEIFEEDEAGSDALEEDGSQSPTPVLRRKKPRSTSSSSSRLPVSARATSPPSVPTLPMPIVATIQVDIDESILKQGKKRISRRQSGLINVASPSGNGSLSSTSSSSRSRAASPPPRAPSPAFGSPLRRDAGLAEEEEEYVAIHGHGHLPADTDEELPLGRATGKGKKKRTLMQVQAEEAPAESDHEREKRRHREGIVESTIQRLQDVTNALGTRVPLPPLDTNLSDQDRQRTSPDTDSDMPSSALTYSSTRPPLSTPGTTPAPSHLPTPRNSSPPPIPIPTAAEPEVSTMMGRERRVRKSINYAEPKLNTKMRKPDPGPAPIPAPVRRTSSTFQPPSEDNLNARSSLEDSSLPAVTERRRKPRPRLPVDDDEESDGAQADDEPFAGGSRMRGLTSNVDTRRRSAVVSSVSRRSLIEDDEGRRHSMLV